LTEGRALLDVREVDAGYGKKQVLFGISLSLQPGEIVAIIGPNGSGKSTTLKVVHGLLPVWHGDLTYRGERLNRCKPAARVSKGITFAPQENRVFAELTVQENLEIGGCQLPKVALRTRIETVLRSFQVLAERRNEIAGRLSGGEQQMLALGRALVPQPSLLMLDEPSLGLSPSLVSEVLEKIVEINRATQTSILIVEQKVREVLKICHRVYSLKLGRVAYDGEPAPLLTDKAKLTALFL
jgi:ABC-type branched-subunit amino acid transport system ATPase component